MFALKHARRNAEVVDAFKPEISAKYKFEFSASCAVNSLITFDFSADKIQDNAQELLSTLMKLKPTSSKGTYVKSIFMSSTMSPSIAVDSKVSS